jgi:hypothetical protein
MMRIVVWSAAFTTGVVAGAFVMGTFGMRSAAAALEPGSQLVLRQHLIRRLSKVMPVLMLCAIATTGAALVFSPPSADLMSVSLLPRETALRGLAFGLSIAMLVQTITVNSPINNLLLGWSAETLPADWQKYVRRWNTADSVRLAMGLIAFGSTLLGGV